MLTIILCTILISVATIFILIAVNMNKEQQSMANFIDNSIHLRRYAAYVQEKQ